MLFKRNTFKYGRNTMNKKYIFFDIDVTLVACGYGITIDNKLIDIKPLPREDMISLIDE